MSRKQRIHYPGACYHVILRGNGGRDIFIDDCDRTRFFLLLQEGLARYKHRIHAYCLMTNHVHLAIQVSEVPLSRIMQNVSFRYTRYMNHRNKQVGHLFQGRYKAVLIDADNYLLELVRYIHNNPIRAGMVKSADDYPWSSQQAYLGNVHAPWLTMDCCLSHFAKQKNKSVQLFREFILAGKEEGHRCDFYNGKIEDRILGEDHFVDDALSRADQEISRRVSFEQIVEKVCNHYGISLNVLRRRGREKRQSLPRSVSAFIVRETDHLQLMDLSRLLHRDLSGLSQAAARLAIKLETDQTLAAQVYKIIESAEIPVSQA